MTTTLTSPLGALLKGRHHPYHHKQKDEDSCYAMTVSRGARVEEASGRTKGGVEDRG